MEYKILFILSYLLCLASFFFCYMVLKKRGTENGGEIILIFLAALIIASFFFLPYNKKSVKYEIPVKKDKVILTDEKIYFYYDGLHENEWDSIIPYDSLKFYNTCTNNIFEVGLLDSYGYERKN